jgi:hypothetical protein
MASLLGFAALEGLILWAFGRRSRTPPAPEDDVTTPIDHEELARAERELGEDPDPREATGGWDEDEDDWGPGAP